MSENIRPGIYTYFVATGEPSWSYEVQAECGDERSDRLRHCESLYGFSATPLSVDGAVITGGLDGRLFVVNSDTGEQLFQFDTVKGFETVNGVEGYGGSDRQPFHCCGIGHGVCRFRLRFFQPGGG